MTGIWGYWDRAIRRSWRDTSAAIVPRTVGSVVRDVAVLVVALWLISRLSPTLLRFGAITSNNVPDTITYAMATAVAVAAVFGAVFCFQLLVLVPYRLWVDACKPEAKWAPLTTPLFDVIERGSVVQHLSYYWGANPLPDADSDPELTVGVLRIEGLRFTLKGKARRRLVICRCYVRPLRGERLEAMPDPDGSLPVELRRGDIRRFRVSLNTRAPGEHPQGMSISEFRQRWIGFSLVVEGATWKTEVPFSAELIDWLLYNTVAGLHWRPRPDLAP